jgi:hypothetical protein
MPRIDIPEKNTYIDFPDETPQEEIQATIESNWDSITARKPPNAVESFVNQITSMPREAFADVQSIFDKKAGLENVRRLEQEKPSRGAGRIAGEIVSGVAPTAAAIAAPLAGKLAAKVAWPAALGYYGVSGSGQARRSIAQYEEETGKDVSGVAETFVTAGSAVVNAGLSYLFMGRFAKPIIEGLSRQTVEHLGKMLGKFPRAHIS